MSVPTGIPSTQATSAGITIWRAKTPTTCVGVKPIAFMIPISRYAEITIPVTSVATIAIVAASANTLNALSTPVRIWLVMLKMLRTRM